MGRAGSPLHPWVLAAAALITLRGGLEAAETATEWKSEPSDATDAHDVSWEGHVWLRDLGSEAAQSTETLQSSALPSSSPNPEPGWNRTQEAGDTLVGQGAGKAAETLQPETPVDMVAFAGSPGTEPATRATYSAKTLSLEGSTLEYNPSGIMRDSGGTSICLACSSGGVGHVPSKPIEGDVEAMGAVTSMAWTADREASALALSKTKKVVRNAEDPEEDGSGDPYGSTPESVLTHPDPTGKERVLGAPGAQPTLLPDQGANTGIDGLESNHGISPDSAETDLLLGVYSDDTLLPPTPGGKYKGETLQIQPDADIGFEPEKEEQSPELWRETTSRPWVQGPQKEVELALPEKGGQLEPAEVTTSPPKTLKSPEAPSDPSVPDIIDIDYYDLFDVDGQGGPEDFPRSPGPIGDSTKKLHDKKPLWALSEHYDDFTPFDESDFYPTTSFYADGDEEGTNQEDDDEDEIEEVEEETRDLEDENDAKPLPFTPKMPTREEHPTGRQQVPQHTFILKSQPDANKDLTQMMAGAGDNGSECQAGYVRFNNSCKSVCDMYPMYCYNSGQCYLVENIGAFCRCNTQDYIWHKGLRCESIITDFQVMCVAVGVAALVVLLLFMMTVFFAKKLYLLKTENYKLRKRKRNFRNSRCTTGDLHSIKYRSSRYRTPSELHNDNFSLSTIAEGSHPNEDPSAPHKLQEPPRCGPKDEEAFNIQNLLSPKAEGEKCEPDSPEVNCLQNNLT